MPKASIKLCFIFTLAFLFSCTTAKTAQTDNVQRVDDSEQVQQVGQLMIRAANKGNQPLENVVIHFSSIDKNGKNPTKQSEEYGDLAPAEVSDYRSVSGSFRYAPMEALVAGELVRGGITDYVGEYKIPNGNYTYKLSYGPNPMNGDSEDLYGRLTYDQTNLDSAIDSALEQEIENAISDEYYRNYPRTIEVDGDIYDSMLRMRCVHQQTHRGVSSSSQTIVYAKVVCSDPLFQPALGADTERLQAIPPLPIRIELHKQDSSFFVVNYQFPQAGSEYKASAEKIFLPSKIEEISLSEIRAATYSHLQLKVL